ncbi:Potential acrAB operon repressor [Sebaldella termitidis]|uniref:Transcriptional regulator, TetR family n=2 Tax=Sebaldella TaxID=32068 RepID=D1ARQ7_SEBTE|nr:TetR/AcrR family transcriptional regulator [Sebaldella termitidis]ACZ10543.1 transcriptional regulator, TetR family [Sebaldella termitidis ATCC 33386]SUI25885.1 Potential acrAB operon repressor [Sebaldella termitidis]
MDKKDVIKITLELIKEKKLEKTSIGEIVKRLDSSPGNLYYHFKSKNDIYKEVLDYSLEEITKYLDRVKTVRNKKNYLFALTRMLIKTFEEREEILFFLIGIKGSYYLNKELDSPNFLISFKNALLDEKVYMGNEKLITLRLNMFLGSIYEVLYVNKLVNNRNLNEKEIEEIYMSFWGNDLEESYKIYEQNDLIPDLSREN